MKKKILMLCMGCFLVSLTAKAQWVVSDPGNLAQGIINAAKNIVHTSSTATNMANSFQETVKIYRQGKEYYDGLRKVKNLVMNRKYCEKSCPRERVQGDGGRMSLLQCPKFLRCLTADT